MDVRCERCRVQYVFGEDQVGPDGLTVRCSNCGHVFLVKKKALVVTVPVKPGDLRQEPVPTADLDRKGPPQGAAPSRASADKGRPWTLRNHRGDLYPFKELSTLQKWIVERKAARDDEVSQLGGPWRRLGDMLELEPFFALVDRAGRAATSAAMRTGGSAPASGAESRGASAQPTLIDFPPARPVFPGPGHQPAPAKTERLPAPPEATKPEPRLEAPPPSPAESTMSLGSAPITADEGPVLQGELEPVSSSEPAWTSQPEGVEKPTRPPPEPRRTKRAGFGPILVVLALAAGAAAVYVTKPGWFGLAGPGFPSAKPEGVQPAPAEGAQPPSRPQGEPAAPRPEKPVAAPEAPVPGMPQSSSPGPSTAAPNAPSTATPPSTSPAGTTGEASPPRDSTPQTSSARPAEAAASPSASPPAQAPGKSTAAPPHEAEKPAAGAGREPPVPPAAKPTKEPPEATPAQAKRRAAAPEPAVSQKPSDLKRLLAEARRLRVRGKPEAALKAYGRALEVEPKNVDALAGRGLCYLELSQYGPAEASFQAALDADARHAEALMGLAETYRYEGRRTEAVTYYQRYVAAHPNGEDAAAARNAIDALKE